MAWSVFCTKLAEVFDRHLGNFSRPSQIVKEAAAEGDAMRLLAAAERDGEKIRKGELDIEVLPGLSQVRVRPAQTGQQLTYGQQIGARIVHQELRREQNLERIAYYATEEEGDGSAAQDREPDEEWLTQFFKNAQDVSSEQLQRLWARLLAGEIKSPGFYSIDTIDFLRRMTSARARQIQLLGPYLFNGGAVVKCEFIQNRDWSTLVFWLDMENLGIVDGVGAAGLEAKYESASQEKYSKSFVYGAKVLICEDDDASKVLKIHCYRVTRLGREVLSLGKFAPDYDYITSVATEIKSKSFTVSMGDVLELAPNGRVKVHNIREVT